MSQITETAIGLSELTNCKQCDYKDGFHLSVANHDQNKGNKGLIAVLICPSCHASYKTDWRIVPD